MKDLGDWMEVNGEGIYDSSAWKVWGEGKVEMARGNLGPAQAKTPYTAQDIRFTTKNGAVYAFLMAWSQDGKAVIRSLPAGAGTVAKVTLLGSNEKLVWQPTAAGLEVALPKANPCKFAFCLKIEGEKLAAETLPSDQP